VSAAGRLAVVDDDEPFRDMLAGNLADAGYAVRAFRDGADALKALSADAGADALVLDWRMPGMSGLDLLKALRGAGIAAPAVFLTSLSDTFYEEAALAAGAVDFVDKTRSFAVLLRRLEMAIAGSRRLPGGERLSLGPLNVDMARHRAAWRGADLGLTMGELRALLTIAQAGRDVGYRQIYDAVRGENFVAGDGAEGYRANVRALIKRLRQKFLAVDPAFAAIENCAGFGYRWTEGR